MKTTNQQMRTFSRLSGDYNPVHIDAEYARRTMFGGQIVYGVYQVMLCLREAVRETRHPIFLTTLKAEFRRALMVEQEFYIDVEVHGGSVKATVRDQAVFSKISFTYEQTENTGTPLAVEEFPMEPRDATKEETRSATEHMGYSVELCRELFPEMSGKVHTRQIGALLGATRFIGMEYPGVNSLFQSMELQFYHGEEESFECTGHPRQSLFGECEVEINSRFVRGKLKAFFRPPVVEQSSIDTLLAKNMIGDFSRQRALVIGGSRGIGLQCLRLLALGKCGGGVLFTYTQSQRESVRVMNDLQQHGFKATMLHLDVTHPGEQSLAALKKFAPTHLYYFATPKISLADKTLNEDRFRTFCDYYIFALHQLIEYLKPAGLRNVFMPSSVAITDFPKDVTEYAMSKAAMECWVRVLNEKKLHVYAPRLPRINTAQTQAMIPVETAAAEDILFPEMLKFENDSLYA